LSFLQLVPFEFGLLELSMLNLFKFHINVLKIKRKPNSPSLLGHRSLQLRCLPTRLAGPVRRLENLRACVGNMRA
jgi:hypothetical protein